MHLVAALHYVTHKYHALWAFSWNPMVAKGRSFYSSCTQRLFHISLVMPIVNHDDTNLPFI